MATTSKKALDILSDDDPSLVSIRLTLTALMKELGGPNGFAAMLANDYTSCEPGSTQSIQLGGKILQSLQTFGMDDTTDNATEEELITMMKGIVAEDPELIEKMKPGDDDA